MWIVKLNDGRVKKFEYDSNRLKSSQRQDLEKWAEKHGGGEVTFDPEYVYPELRKMSEEELDFDAASRTFLLVFTGIVTIAFIVSYLTGKFIK